MMLGIAYFLISILLGVFHFWHLFSMLRHAGAESNDYFMAGIAILWVPISLVASVCLRKKIIYLVSPLSYVSYFAINYFTSAENGTNAELDAGGIACVIFGLYYAALNSWFLIWALRKEREQLKVARQTEP